MAFWYQTQGNITMTEIGLGISNCNYKLYLILKNYNILAIPLLSVMFRITTKICYCITLFYVHM